MTAATLPIRLQDKILFQSKSFLLQIQAGASDDVLTTLLFQIRSNETELMKQEQLTLHPGVWHILLSRYLNRKLIEIIDTLN